MLTVWPAGRDDRRARVLVWTGWWVSVAFGAAELFVQGPYDAGTGLGDVTQWSLLDATLHTDFGVAHSLRLICSGRAGRRHRHAAARASSAAAPGSRSWPGCWWSGSR